MICSTVCWPSQRSTSSRVGPFKRRARSGISSTRCWLFSPRRQPGARRGRLFSSGGIRAPSRFLRRLEGAWWRPAGINVSKIEGIKLSPENVALSAQRGVRQVLLRARVRVFHDPSQSEFGIFGSLRKAAGEIVKTTGEPGIVLAHAVHPQSNEFVRKQFGQGRSDGFEMRARGYEIDVGLYGETCGGKNAVTEQRLFTREARSRNEPQPLFNAAGLHAIAVMVEDALAPGEPKCGIFAAREDGRIFDGDAALIVVPIQGPCLELAARELAVMHQQMKRMFVVIALFADGVKAGNERGFREQRLFEVVFHG